MQGHELHQRIEAKRAPLIIGARGEIEFRRGHIKGAINAPVRNLLLHRANLPPVTTDRGAVVICKHGQRPAVSEGLLSLYGYRNTEFLEGFLEGWREAGLPLETSRRQTTLLSIVAMTSETPW